MKPSYPKPHTNSPHMAGPAAPKTLPAFVVPVEVRPAPGYGDGHQGVFATAPIKAGTKVWEWTDLVHQIHRSEMPALLERMQPEDAAVFLRQGFVTPDASDYFNSNPEDAGRFTNHSASPSIGFHGAVRDIEAGEELTIDYAWHGDPEWYRELCAKYGVLTERQVSETCRTADK